MGKFPTNRSDRQRFAKAFTQNTSFGQRPSKNTVTRHHLTASGHSTTRASRPESESETEFKIPLKPHVPLVHPPNEKDLMKVVDESINPDSQIHDPSELSDEQTQVSCPFIALTS
jgi:hypothetical protein